MGQAEASGPLQQMVGWRTQEGVQVGGRGASLAGCHVEHLVVDRVEEQHPWLQQLLLLLVVVLVPPSAVPFLP